jgi:acetyltransferase-like isoleucine patch superfamily enzyme
MIARKLFSALRRARQFVRSKTLQWYLPLAYPGIRCHRSVRFGRGVTVCAFDGGRLDIGPDTLIDDGALVQVDRGHLHIGAGCRVGRGAVIVCLDRITIGAGTLIAEHVTIRDQDHLHHGDLPLDAQGMTASPITIGENCWLGAKATVTRGVFLADHVVIGANAVVTRDAPQRGVYAGIPARRIG